MQGSLKVLLLNLSRFKNMKEKPKQENEYKGCISIITFILVVVAWFYFGNMASTSESLITGLFGFLATFICLFILIRMVTKGNDK